MGPLGPQAPILGRHVSVCASMLGCVHYYIRLYALLYQVVCANILACVTIGRVLVYCNFHTGGYVRWLGPEGSNAPTLDCYIVACSTILGCMHHRFKYSYSLNVQLYVFKRTL